MSTLRTEKSTGVRQGAEEAEQQATEGELAGKRRPSRFAALRRNRDFRMLWLGLVGSNLGATASGIAVPLLAYALTGSELTAGIIGSAGFVAMLLAQMPAGYLADMMDRRKIMLWCEGLRLAAVGVLIVAVLTGTAGLVLLVTVNMAVTALWVFCGAAQTQALRQLVPRDQVPEAVALSQARGHAVSLAGPSVGGGLFALGRTLPFVLEALTSLLCMLFVWRIRRPLKPENRPSTRRLLPDVGQGWAELWRQPFLRALASYAVMSNVVHSVLMYVLIIGTADNALLLGGSVTGVAVAGLLGSLVSPFLQRRLGLRSIVVGVELLRGGLLLTAALVGGTPAFLVALVASMFLTPVIGAATATARILLIPAKVLSRCSAALTFLASSTLPAAPLLAGWLLETTSARFSHVVVGVGFLLVAVLAFALPGLDFHVRTEPEHEDSAGARPATGGGAGGTDAGTTTGGGAGGTGESVAP